METCGNHKNQFSGYNRTCNSNPNNIFPTNGDQFWDDNFPIGMAYVPWQHWGEIYTGEHALKEGTIFKELNKEFKGVRC